MGSKCPSCGDQFSTIRAMHIHHKKLHGYSIAEKKQTCKQCGKVFYHRRDRAYCGTECQNDSMVVDKSVTCSQCGIEFETDKRNTQKYCSMKCSAKSQEKKEYTVCDQCGEEFSHNPCHDAIYCSNDCRLTARWGDYEENPKSRKSSQWVRFSKKYRNWVNECENCQSEDNLHVHHDSPLFKGGDLWDNTFTVLCGDCHIGNFSDWH